MLQNWSNVYLIGIPKIDQQHQGFFSAAHHLYEKILDRAGKQAVQDAINFMKRYAREHFQAEEEFMRCHEYPGLLDHQKLHIAFFQRLDSLDSDLIHFGPTQDLAERALDITQDWLIDHIADEDMLYALHFKSKQS